jgi:hypothetical protein
MVYGGGSAALPRHRECNVGVRKVAIARFLPSHSGNASRESINWHDFVVEKSDDLAHR